MDKVVIEELVLRTFRKEYTLKYERHDVNKGYLLSPHA